MKAMHYLTLAAAALATSSAFAAPITLKNLDNPGGIVGFSAFDWSSVGQGYITGYDITSLSPTTTVDPFTLRFQATATGLQQNGVDLFGAPVANLNTTYEYTIFVTLQEVASCVAPGPAGPCSLVQLNATGGTFDIYYDTTPGTFANYAAGTGFTDGLKIVSGTVTGQSNPVFLPQGLTNPGTATAGAGIFGPVTLTNATFLTPMLTGASSNTTLQFGGQQSAGFIAPASFNGSPVVTNNANFIAQVDANTSFATAVPEPDVLMLFGIGALGLVLGARRRSQRA